MTRLVVAALVVLAFAAAACAWHPAIAPVAPPSAATFDARTVAAGAALAGVGNCASCHTLPEGPPYAGGVPLATPFGTIHGTNLTPDDETGLGRWSYDAFARAMRDGVSRDGHLLYPAFPYTHFTHATDDELKALYAYLMTRDAVHRPPVPNALTFPLQFRPLVAGWNLLNFHDRGPRSSGDRGADLIDGLAHCGGCHTPRDRLGAEQERQPLAGNVIEGWYAPPLDANSPSPVPWTVEAMTAYLRTGLVDDHAMAGGPMAQAVAGLADASEADVRAIAATIVAGMGPATDARRRREDGARTRASRPLAESPAARSDDAAVDAATTDGATIYATTCAGCHDRGRDVGSDGALRLPLAVALYDDDPASFLRIVRDGIQPPAGTRGRVMPAYGTSLSDAQLVALAAYLRHAAADAPPWPALDRAVAASRKPS